MKETIDLLKSGFLFNRDKLKLLVILIFSVIFLTMSIEYIFKKGSEQSQLLWVLSILLAENFLTCGLYGSLKEIISGKNLNSIVFFSNGARFFSRFLIIKFCFVFFIIFLGTFLFLIAYAVGKMTLPGAAGFAFLWLIWLAFPSYFFVMALFAPIVLFSQNSGVIESIKKGIIFSRKNIDRLIVLVFFFIFLGGFLVYLPEKIYNFSSGFWTVCKSVIISVLEISFISCLLFFYQKESKNEGNI